MPASGNTMPANNAKYSDVISVAKAELRSINALVKSSLPSQKDSLSSYHLQDISDRIEEALNPKG
jgi:hypothetical protein